MQQPTTTVESLMSLYANILRNIHTKENEKWFHIISEIISPNSERIAKNFYKEMLSYQKASVFLNHDEVKKRLTYSMKNWIESSVIFLSNKEQIENYINSQQKIGHIHAKIGLPVSLVNYGMSLIKKDIMNAIISSDLNRAGSCHTMMVVNQVLDCALQIINECYEHDVVINEKDSHAFKLQFSANNLALDFERLRTSLSDWMRDLLLATHSNNVELKNFRTIRQSSFGLWMSHKAKLFLVDRSEYAMLMKLLDDIDEWMHKLIQVQRNEHEKQNCLEKLNNLVSKTNWVLSETAREIIDQDNGKDPLTKLFNRRYLDMVLRHETTVSITTGATYAVTVLDIDYFKKINDTYGHDNGDKVLAQLAEILTSQVRAGDFIFRLGGEEFLIVFSDVKPHVVNSVAEKIRSNVEKNSFLLAGNRSLNVTISIGVAIHDGHPDFARTMKRADDALYEAKNNGRNQVVVAKGILTYEDLDSAT